jgi:RNA polymerase sigma-70 factor (ECF subfamily)
LSFTFFFIGRVNPSLNGIFVENNFTTLDKAGFKKVFDKYFDSIRGYIYYRTGDADVASDLAQDIFMKLWEKKERLDDDYIKGLLYKMASDIVISQYRKDVVKSNYRANMRIEGEVFSPQDMAEFEEMKNRYSEALLLMPNVQRATFLMSREEDLKYHEIAQRLGVSVKTVEKRISGALQILKNKLLR